MTPESLYDLFRESTWMHTLAEPPEWDQLSEPEQAVWQEMAERVVPWEE